MTESCQLLQSQRPDGLWEGYALLGGMTCAACAIEVEQEGGALAGVKQIEVNAASGLTHWVTDSPEVAKSLSSKVGKLGYDLVQSGGLDEVNTRLRKTAQRSEALRLLIAMLCMMQIMMYATPEYLFPAQEIGQSETLLLRWAQWVLCLPVLLYSAKPIFSAAWRAVKSARWSVDQPVALGLMVAFVYSSANLHQLEGHIWLDSLAMLVSLLTLSRFLVNSESMRALTQLMAIGPDIDDTVEIDKLGQRVPQKVSNLRLGDTYWLKTGQTCPVDSDIPSASGGVWVDESMRTGESSPVFKPAAAVLLAGAKLLSSPTCLKVQREGLGAFFDGLQKQIQQAVSSKPKQQQAVERLVPWFVFAVFSVTIIGAVAWWLHSASLELSLRVAVAILLVSCPCALALSWPLVRLFAMRNLASHGVYVRNGEVFEVVPKLSHICLDKTGTLTDANRAVVNIQWLGDNLLPEQCYWREMLLLEVTSRSPHPLSQAIQRELMHLHGVALNLSVIKIMDVPSCGVEAVVSVDDDLLDVRVGSAEFCKVKARDSSADGASTVYVSARVHDSIFEYAAMAVCEVALPVEIQSKAWLRGLYKHGLSVDLISGDKQSVVDLWAAEMLFDHKVGGMTVQDKRDWIDRLQNDCKAKVLMCGDGLNDAAALTQADISVCVSHGAGLSAKQADVFLKTRAPEGISRLIAVGQTASKIGWQNMIGSLVYNVLAIGFAVSGYLHPWMAAVGMGLSSLLVLINSLRISRVNPRIEEGVV